jgi:hypothetical protein
MGIVYGGKVGCEEYNREGIMDFSMPDLGTSLSYLAMYLDRFKYIAISGIAVTGITMLVKGFFRGGSDDE